MVSNSELISYLLRLIFKTTFEENTAWVLISLKESLKEKLIIKSKKEFISEIIIWENFELKSIKGKVYNNLNELKNYEIYYFIDNPSIAQQYVQLLEKNSFLFALKEIKENLEAMLILKNKYWNFFYITNFNQSAIIESSNTMYFFLNKLGKCKSFEKICIYNKKNKANARALAGRLKVETGNDFNIFELYSYELISPYLEKLEKGIYEIGYEKKYDVDALVDLIHGMVLDKAGNEILVVIRELIIVCYLNKIKKISDCCTKKSKDFFEELKCFKAFVKLYSISSILLQIIKKKSPAELVTSFLYDYFVNSSIQNLKVIVDKKFSAQYIDATSDRWLFEIINGAYTNHVLDLLIKKTFIRELKKSNQIRVDAINIEEARKIVNNKTSLMNSNALNQFEYKIKAVSTNSFKAYPKKETLKIMLRETIPKSLLIISGNHIKTGFISKSIIGGKIALKNYVLTNLQDNINILKNIEYAEIKQLEETKDKKVIDINIMRFLEDAELKRLEDNGIISDCKKIISKAENDEEIKKSNLNDEENKGSEEEIKSKEIKLGVINQLYKDLTYYKLNQLEKMFDYEALLYHPSEVLKITRKSLAEDKLYIAKAIFFMVLSHEIFHIVMTKYATDKSFSNRTREIMHQEVGLYIDKSIYGNYIKSLNLNSQKMTIAIAEKIFNFQDFTQKEAETVCPMDKGRTFDEGVYINDEFDEEYFDICQYICTGRIARKNPIILDN